jgi:2-haloacid dehalogenase
MYQPALDAVRTGRDGWVDLDEINRLTLPAAFRVHGLAQPDPAFIRRAVYRWHELDPWPDSAPGLRRLTGLFELATLSNGHRRLLEDLADHGQLSFSRVLSAEDAQSYKPDPVVYRKAAELLELDPDQIMMVAAHRDDLAAAASVGYSTAYVNRPLEWGPSPRDQLSAAAAKEVDVWADDIQDLAERLTGRC